MKVIKKAYEKITGKPAPYYYDYSILTILSKMIRKFVAQVIAPNCPFNVIRIWFYRLCGFKIGKHTFIGMKCYLDDMCYDLLTIGDNVIISYGVYFACHGRGQSHLPIIIENGAYIGMRANVISKNINSVAGGTHRFKIGDWSLYSCEPRYSRRCYGSWYSVQNCQLFSSREWRAA